LKSLLRLQELDLRIEACRAREQEIPKQKGRFDIQRARLAANLEEREKACRDLQLAQRSSEVDIEKVQTQVAKYQQNLLSVKKNEEYQVLLHEIEALKKQVGLLEERILAIMVELDEAKARLAEDRKRTEAEIREIDRQCAAIDVELAEATRERQGLEREREPLVSQVEAALMNRYQRIRASKRTGPAVVPLRGDHCSGCNMAVPPQVVNEVLAGKIHGCNFCGRLLYSREYYEPETISIG